MSSEEEEEKEGYVRRKGWGHRRRCDAACKILFCPVLGVFCDTFPHPAPYKNTKGKRRRMDEKKGMVCPTYVRIFCVRIRPSTLLVRIIPRPRIAGRLCPVYSHSPLYSVKYYWTRRRRGERSASASPLRKQGKRIRYLSFYVES